MVGTHERCGCRFGDLAPAHHDRLVSIETDVLGTVLELVELAATWNELEYSESEPLLAPGEWIEFAMAHEWRDPKRIVDLMIALSSLVARPARDTLASVIPLFPTSGEWRDGRIPV
jgi:hypothetical protein